MSKKNLVVLNPRKANGPDGYPKYDPEHPFWIAAAKVLDRRRKDAEQAEKFLKRLSESFKNE